jgi:hypothetical protein
LFTAETPRTPRKSLGKNSRKTKGSLGVSAVNQNLLLCFLQPLFEFRDLPGSSRSEGIMKK